VFFDVTRRVHMSDGINSIAIKPSKQTA